MSYTTVTVGRLTVHKLTLDGRKGVEVHCPDCDIVATIFERRPDVHPHDAMLDHITQRHPCRDRCQKPEKRR